VEIGGSVYLPIAMPQRIEELFSIVLEMAAEQDGIYLDAPDQYRKAKQQEARRLARLAQKGQAA
jgi:hypothetical protein